MSSKCHNRKPRLGARPDLGHGSLRGILGYWPLLEGGGAKTFDHSGRNNHGTLAGFSLSGFTSNWCQGTAGPAVHFDGVDDRIGLSRVITLPTNVTFVAWIQLSTIAGSYMGLIGDADAGALVYWGFGVNQAKLLFELRSSSGNHRGWVSSSPDLLSVGKWRHIAVTQSGGVLSTPVFYVDGMALGATVDFTAGTPVTPVAQGTSIGRVGLTSGSSYFSGKAAEVRIYNRVLSQPEIASLYVNSWRAYPLLDRRSRQGISVAVAAKFRKTLSSYGSGTGKRQAQAS